MVKILFRRLCHVITCLIKMDSGELPRKMAVKVSNTDFVFRAHGTWKLSPKKKALGHNSTQ